MIGKFAADLADAFQRSPAGAENIRTESDFEREFAIPVATRVARQHPHVSLFVHPWSSKKRCHPTCHGATGAGRVLGCPRCWKDSKEWGTVAAFGTKHTFDMVAKGHGKSLAIEIKLVDARRSKMPNGDIQRFLGQCALAAAKHDAVIGLCGHLGTLNTKSQGDSEKVQNWSARQNVRLVFVPVA